jgi:hypothetical protein
MNGTILTAWTLAWVAVAIALVAGARRIGRARAGAWLVVIGLFLLTIEEPLLTVWLALVGPDGDPDGLATLVTPMARAHVLDAGTYGTGVAVLLATLALTGMKRGERRAWRILTWSFIIAVLTEAATTTLVFSRGLALPGVAGSDRFGWQPLAVGLLTWAAGLVLARPMPTARPALATADTHRGR